MSAEIAECQEIVGSTLVCESLSLNLKLVMDAAGISRLTLIV